MAFPDYEDRLHPEYPPKDAFRGQLLYPTSYDGQPAAISPTGYGLNYKPSAMDKVKNGFQGTWLGVVQFFRERTVWFYELGNIYQDSFYRSTIPSADVLASPRREPIRKLLWCAVLGPLIYLTIADLRDVIEGYMQYPVIYTYEYKTKDTLEFPDVTICNVNPFKKSRACANDSLLFKSKTFYDFGEEFTLPAFCNDDKWMCTRLCGSAEEVKLPNRDDIRIRAKLAKWMKKTIALGKRGNTAISDLGHKVHDIVKKCSYASNDDCTTDFTRFTKTMSQLFGSCFCFHCEEKIFTTTLAARSPEERKVVEERQREWKKYHEYGTLSSPLSGLVIQLNTEVNEYLPTSLDVGFVAMIHEHNKDYSICQDSIYVLPGYTTYIGLSLATTQNLEPPYQDGCRKEWPKELKEGNFEANVKVMDPLVVTQQYSRAMCLEYCKIEYLIFKCKCIQNNPAVKIHQDLTENYKYCKTLRKQNCTEMELAGKTNIDWQLRCDCRRECEMQRYSTDVSVAGLIAENSEIPESQNDTAKLFVDMSSARLVVYFHSFTYEHIKAIRKYDEIRLLSNIGGINGMYLGLSFYLLFQALDIIISGAIQFVQKLRSAKFTFGQDGNQKSSIAVQTSDCADRRRRNAAPYIYPASESTPETPFYVGQMKNIWDVFEKPSGNNSYNTTEQFKTTHGSFAFRYNKK